MFISGDKPGLGVYTCKECGLEVVVDRDSMVLPCCPRCGCGSFLLYGRKE